MNREERTQLLIKLRDMLDELDRLEAEQKQLSEQIDQLKTRIAQSVECLEQTRYA